MSSHKADGLNNDIKLWEQTLLSRTVLIFIVTPSPKNLFMFFQEDAVGRQGGFNAFLLKF